MNQLTQSELVNATKLMLGANTNRISGWICVWCWKCEDEEFKCKSCNYENSVLKVKRCN